MIDGAIRYLPETKQKNTKIKKIHLTIAWVWNIESNTIIDFNPKYMWKMYVIKRDSGSWCVSWVLGNERPFELIHVSSGNSYWQSRSFGFPSRTPRNALNNNHSLLLSFRPSGHDLGRSTTPTRKPGPTKSDPFAFIPYPYTPHSCSSPNFED